jgi:dihydroorotate dehydrogenase
MPLPWGLIRPLLFRLDPEKVHHLAMGAVVAGTAKGGTFSHPSLEREFFGVKFRNPVGLAAGFDKDGVALDRWKDFGFGFIEVGTVTRHAQPGNPKPRLFRLLEHKALINRMGFNNEGADALASRLEKAHPGIPVGVNIGKSKVTPVEEAVEDYAYSYKRLKELGDYFVVNVSSPNTPGLRELQDKAALTRILWRLKEIDSRKPLFVKIAPDLTDEQIDDVAQVATQLELTGVIATNTTISRAMLPVDPKIDGGLSGAPVKAMADHVLERLAQNVDGKLILIGVGGIMTAADARRKLDLGASLVQVYSGWIYGGPTWVPDLCRDLTAGPAAIGSSAG